MRLYFASEYKNFSNNVVLACQLQQILKSMTSTLQRGYALQLATPTSFFTFFSMIAAQTQKVAPARDFASDRLQHRAGGRQSSGPDTRRASLTSFAGESEDRKSRESTPRLNPTPGPSTGHPVRRRRKYYLTQFIIVSYLFFSAAPLNLANSPSLHLLTDGEKTLCSSLRLLPKPYLVVKETLVREYARRGGKLRRREARDLVKIDVNKLSRVWDFLVQSGYLKITNEQSASTAPSIASSASQSQGTGYVVFSRIIYIDLGR
jgi:transcriptional adapter 2-alpha